MDKQMYDMMRDAQANALLHEHVVAMTTMAKGNRIYYLQLVAEGFSETQALELTKAHGLSSRA